MNDRLVTRAEVTRALEVGNEHARDLIERMMSQLESERRVSRARLELLREHYGYVRIPARHVKVPRTVQVPGKVAPCENPQRYGTDCGECMRCRSIYASGALKQPTGG